MGTKRALCHDFGSRADSDQGWPLPVPVTDRPPDVPLQEPGRCQRLKWENEMLGFMASGHHWNSTTLHGTPIVRLHGWASTSARKS